MADLRLSCPANNNPAREMQANSRLVVPAQAVDATLPDFGRGRELARWNATMSRFGESGAAISSAAICGMATCGGALWGAAISGAEIWGANRCGMKRHPMGVAGIRR
jgi:hypothetical protein